MNPDLEMSDKLQIMADGLVQNWGMWITVVAFIAVILLVHLIRTRSFDHAWRISIIVGGVAYVFIMLVGSFGLNLNATVAMVPLLICTAVAVLLGLVLEFFAFGGVYSRAERLEYEDDEYFYYVKAVPKASVATSERSIKKINAEPIREERKAEEQLEHMRILFSVRMRNQRGKKLLLPHQADSQDRQRNRQQKMLTLKKNWKNH